MRGGGGGGGSVATRPTRRPPEELSELRILLQQETPKYGSVGELSEILTVRINELINAILRLRGVQVSKQPSPKIVFQGSYEKARSGLSSLMTSAQANLVATISKRDAPEDAIALVNCGALDLILNLAEQGLIGEPKFGDLMPDPIEPEVAARIAALNIHIPLPGRKTAAERRRMREELMPEVE